MDQPILPSERRYNKFLPLLPFLVLGVLLLGKKQNRAILKGQIDYIMADREKDLETIYDNLEDVVLRNMHQSYGDHLFIRKYNEQIEDYPIYESEITMIASHIAKIYGGEFVVWHKEKEKQESLYGLGKNEIPNVDEIPCFKGCNDFTKVGRAICSESLLNQFIDKQIRNVEKEGSVTIEVKVEENGKLSGANPITSSDTPEELVQAALKIINKMPIWEPAKRSGKPVSTKIFIPFIFSKNGIGDLYTKEIKLNTWKREIELPMYQTEKEEGQLKRLLRMCLYADSNKERELRKIQFSKKIRYLLTNYPEQEANISALITAEADEMNIPISLITNEQEQLIDVTVDLKDHPEPSYNDEDQIYADLMNIIEPYENNISLKAELAIEEALADLFWNFINRFPEDVSMAQAALQHACNSKKISTHTVKIQKDESKVIIDLLGRKR